MAAHTPRAEAIVDLDALRHNVALLAERAATSGAATMAVVKADGYGHGALPVARAALEAGAGLARLVLARRGARAARGPASPRRS